jgi:competence protein ComEC
MRDRRRRVRAGLARPSLLAAAAHSPFLPLPALQATALLVLVMTLLLWKRRTFPVAAVAVACSVLFVLCAGMAAQRTLPPRDDISQLVRAQPSRAVPQGRLPVTLSGTVAGHPQSSDFGIEFPLQCRALQTVATASTRSAPTRLVKGRVWVSLPPQFSPAAPLRVGDELTLRADLADLSRAGNSGERSRQARYIMARCWSIARVRKAEDVRITQRGADASLEGTVAKLRASLMAHYQAAFTAPDAGHAYPHARAQLLVAMVFGEGGLQQSLPRLTRDQFRAAGLSHLLVASGAQVAFLAGALIGVARLLRLRHVWLLLLVVPSLLLYALVAGGAASIWRATVGGICVAWALLLGRDTDGLSLWSLAFLVLLIVDPLQLHDLGFQLTFAATWGLLVVAPALLPRLERMAGAGWLSQLAALSLGAQLATTPLLLYHFGRVSLVGLGANFIAVPLAAILVTTGVAGLVITPLNSCNYALVSFMDGVASFAARAPGAQTQAPPVPLLWTLVCYGLLLLALVPMWRNGNEDTAASTHWRVLRDTLSQWWQRRREKSEFRPQSSVVALVLVGTIGFVWRTWQARDNTLRIAVLDVGQGEAIVVQSASGRTVLIDGGTVADEGRGEVGRTVIVPYLQSIGVKRLDAMVLTHATPIIAMRCRRCCAKCRSTLPLMAPPRTTNWPQHRQCDPGKRHGQRRRLCRSKASVARKESAGAGRAPGPEAATGGWCRAHGSGAAGPGTARREQQRRGAASRSRRLQHAADRRHRARSRRTPGAPRPALAQHHSQSGASWLQDQHLAHVSARGAASGRGLVVRAL